MTLENRHEFVIKEVKKRWFRPAEITVEYKMALE